MDRTENQRRMQEALAKKGFAPTWGDRARLFGEGVSRRLAPLGEALYEGTIGFLNGDLTDSARGKIMGAPPLPPPGDPNEIFVTAPRRTIGQRLETFGNDLREGIETIPQVIGAAKPVAKAVAPAIPLAVDTAKQEFARAATYGPAVDAYDSFKAGDEAFRRGDERAAGDAYADAGGQGLMFAANALGVGAEVAGARLPLTIAQAGKSVIGAGPGWRAAGKLEEAAEVAGLRSSLTNGRPLTQYPEEAFAYVTKPQMGTPSRPGQLHMDGFDVVTGQPNANEYRFAVRESTTIPDSMYMDLPRIDEVDRGKGLGILGYQAAVKEAERQGLGFQSGMWTSPYAKRVWEGLERRGFDVQTNPTIRDAPVDGYYSSADNKPNFTIAPPLEMPADFAPTPPRTDVTMSERTMAKAANRVDESPVGEFTAADRVSPDLTPEPAPARRYTAGMTQVESPYEGRPPVDVQINPSQADIGRMVREQKALGGGMGGAKWAVDKDGNLYVWPAEANHDDVAGALGLEWAGTSRGSIELPEQIGDATRAARQARGSSIAPSLPFSPGDVLAPLSAGAATAGALALGADDAEAAGGGSGDGTVSPLTLAAAAALGAPLLRGRGKGAVKAIEEGTEAAVKSSASVAGTANATRTGANAARKADPRDLMLAHADGTSFEDTALDFDLTPNSAKVLTTRVRNDLRKQLAAGRSYEDLATEHNVTPDVVEAFVNNTGKRARSGFSKADFVREIVASGQTDSAAILRELNKELDLRNLPRTSAKELAAELSRARRSAGIPSMNKPLTQDEIDSIRTMRENGTSVETVAKRLGRSVPTITKARRENNIPSILGPAAAAAGLGAAAIGGAPEARAEDQSEPFDPGYEVVIRPDADYSGGQWQRQRMQRVPLPDGSDGVIVPWRVKETGEERLVLRALENGVPADIIGEVKPTLGGPIRPKWPGENERGVGENYPTGSAQGPWDMIPRDPEPDAGNQGAVWGAATSALARLFTMRGLRGAQGVNTGGLVIGPIVGGLTGAATQIAQERDAEDVIKGTIGGAIGGSAGSIGTDLARVGARDVAIPALRFVDDKVSDAIRYKQLWPQRRGPERGLFEGASQQDVADALFQFEDARNATALPSNPQAVFRPGQKIPPLFPDTSVPPPYEYDKWPKNPRGGAGGGRGGGAGGAGEGGSTRTPREPMDPEVMARMQRAAATGLKGKPVGELRQAGEVLGVPGAATMRKDELVSEISRRMAADGQRSNRLLRQAGISLGLAGALAIPALEPPTTGNEASPF